MPEDSHSMLPSVAWSTAASLVTEYVLTRHREHITPGFTVAVSQTRTNCRRRLRCTGAKHHKAYVENLNKQIAGGELEAQHCWSTVKAAWNNGYKASGVLQQRCPGLECVSLI
jgi:hypothetical protein